MKLNSNIFTLEYPDIKNIIACGDIHGNFNELVFKLCVQYQLHDTLLIVAGDCGFGFEKQGYYQNMVKLNSRRMSQNNNTIVFIRGNHDNPAYFNGKTFNYKRFIAVPDYTIIKARSRTILCAGGAISIDREYRITSWMQKNWNHSSNYNKVDKDPLMPHYYWQDESPIYDKEKLNLIKQLCKVDTVITHTAPSFCELTQKDALKSFATFDETLLNDVDRERATIDQIYNHLKTDFHPLRNWYYGHFHQTHCASIDNVLFDMLDIMEFREIY